MQDRKTVLRHRDARRLWIASACSAAALWSVQIAIAIHVLQDHSVATLAAIGLIATLPSLLLTPIAGICADRFNVRRVSLVVMGLQIGCLLLLAGATQSSLPVVAVLYACQGALSMFWLPARQRWLYSVVPVDLRHQANAAIGSINGIMSIVGAAGGGLLSSWHPAVAIMAAGGLQALGYLQLLRVRATETQSVVRTLASLSSVWTELREGVQAAQHFPLARSVVLIGIAWGLIGGGYNILLAGHVTQGLHGDAATLGLVYVADGLSVIVGTAIAGRITRSRHLAVYAGAYVLQGAAWALTFAASQLALAVGCLIVMRLASGLIIALDMTILLDKVPDRLRGRITSLHMTTYNAVARISLGALSATLTVLSVTTVGLISGIASVVVGIAWWCWSGRHARALYLARDTETGIDNVSMEKT